MQGPFLLTSYPEGLAPQKPQQEITAEELLTVLARGAITTKKYNGNRIHILNTATGVIRLFSRNGTLEWTHLVPGLVRQLALLDWPVNTLADAELYVPNPAGGMESTQLLQRIVGATSEAAAHQAEREFNPRIAVFDLLILNGKSCLNTPLQTRLQQLSLLGCQARVHLAETVAITSLQQALDLILVNGWEGLVVADLSGCHKANWQGNTKRGSTWKIKPRYTEEFLVKAFTVGKTPETLALGILTLKLSSPSGKVYTVGSFELDFDRKGNLGLTGYLVEVSHFGYDDDGNLMFPKVLRRRDDISIQEWQTTPRISS